jgi:hypothetical protein
MGFQPVAVYYNKTQHTNNTPHSNEHSTQNYTLQQIQLQLQLNKCVLKYI